MRPLSTSLLLCFISIEGNGRSRDGTTGHGIDPTRSTATKSGPGSQRSPDIRDGCTIREKRANLQLRTSAVSSRLDDAMMVKHLSVATQFES